jgi:hypothetical protein
MKKLKIILLASVICFVSTQAITAQVTVSQAFVDDANQAFRELPALRAANKAQLGEIEALKEARDANARAATSLADVNELLKADNADLRKLKCDSMSVFFVIRWKRCK